MDPFFKSRGQTRPWGTHNSYLEDISRTYGKSLGPSLANRTSETYERALEFRRKEVAERDRERAEFAALRRDHDVLQKKYEHLMKFSTESYSKLKSDYERAVNSSNRSGGSDRVSSARPSDAKLPDTDSAQEPDSDTRPSGASEERVDPGGSSGEHDAEGRLGGRTDTEGSAKLPEGAVHD